jgi:plastocyanin
LRLLRIAQHEYKFEFQGEEKVMKGNFARIGLAGLMITLLAMLTTAGSVGGAAAQEKAAASAEVKIDNFSFGPTALTVPVGTTATWTNRDDIPHTVVSTDNVFKSKALDTDDKFSFVFSKPGTYSYFCSIHPKMTGQIIVQ